ncbi:hypothetical protein F0562_030861 [Nyssa sinensis]|uniref:Phospho-2-dehydro-3-deoxyheptonate aldolase n=1 Tax=Nyssa sinensis TaxID=561372 RepID=A0A5J5AZL6_9ASTE|nr:hypothetical protein F0562_030861 [Nyssa sinensis]
MALTNSSSALSSNSLLKPQPLTPYSEPISFSHLPTNSNPKPRPINPILAVHAADHFANKSSNSTPTANTTPPRWTLDNWKSKSALQLPEYPDQVQLDSVLKTLASFPPIVFAGEARSLEDRLAQAAVGDAFLLQGGDCAESFKEFNANNIRDTFRIRIEKLISEIEIMVMVMRNPRSVDADHGNPKNSKFQPCSFY